MTDESLDKATRSIEEIISNLTIERKLYHFLCGEWEEKIITWCWTSETLKLTCRADNAFSGTRLYNIAAGWRVWLHAIPIEGSWDVQAFSDTRFALSFEALDSRE